jgi:fatty acid-binding protein DegV
VMARRGETGPTVKIRGVEKARDHLLKLATREVNKGLKSPFVSLSFSGDIGQIAALPAYEALQAACATRGVAISLKAMSPTNSINVGPDALSVGFAAADHDPSI